MSSTYGAPAQNLPTGPRSRTNSLHYALPYDRPPPTRGRSVSPPPARRYSGYTQSNNYRPDQYWYQDSHHDYGRTSPERYGGSYWDSTREHYDQRRPISPVSPYPRSREPSGSWRDSETMATRVFEPSDSWKQRDRSNTGGSSNDSPQRFYSQDTGTWSSYSRYDDDRHYRPGSYDPDAPAVRSRYDSYRSDHDQEGENHRQSSYSRSPHRRQRRSRRSYSSEGSKSRSPRYRSRSRSRSRIISRTPSQSRSRSRRLGRSSRSRSRLRSSSSRSFSRSRSRSSRSTSRSRFPNNSSLTTRYIDSEASTPVRLPSPSVTQNERDGTRKNANSTVAPSANTRLRSRMDHLYSNRSRPASPSRSPSHSSIASSRETSVKPSDLVVHGLDTPVASQSSLDIENTTLLSQSDNKCPPSHAESTVLPQNLDAAGLCFTSEVPTQPETNGKKSEHDRVAEVKIQELPADKAAKLPSTEPLTFGDEQTHVEQIVESAATPVIGDGTSSKDSRNDRGQPGVESGDSVDTLPQPSQPPLDQKLIPDFGPDDVPSMSDATSVREALRIVVMTRLLADRQTREERVEPILATNLSLPRFPHEKIPSVKQSHEVLMQEMFEPTGTRARSRNETFRQVHAGLVEMFDARQAALKVKVQKLKEEYLSLHEKWVEHCTRLDDQAKAKQAASAAEAPVQPSVLPPANGRTTRRSAATMGDAVRSDLEMEQIIASIGYDEATDPNQLCVRNLAVIPDMISVTNGYVDYVFDDNNLRIDNPAKYYAPDTGIHDWTEEEKQVFLDKFAAYPKQFGMIAKFLPNKTTAQCVNFYYLHKKVSIDFRNVVAMNAPGKKGKRRTGKRKGNALLADIRKHDAEVGPTTRGKGKRTSAATAASLEARKTRRVTGINAEDTPTTATPTPEPESRPRRRRVAGPLAISARSSLAVALNEAEEEATDNDSVSRPAKRAKRARKVKSAAIINDDISTPPPLVADGENKNADTESSNRRRAVAVWSDDDKELFLKLLGQHGDDFKRISASMPNKTTAQVSNFYRNHIDELSLREIVKNALRNSLPPISRHASPPMASLPLDDEPTGGEVQSTATSVSVTPALAESVAGQPVPMHSRDLGAVYQGYSGYTTPYGAHATMPVSVYSTAAKDYHTSGYGAVAYGSYGSSAPGVFPNSAYASTRSAYYPYPYSYSVPAAPYNGSATTPSASTTAGGAANPYTDPRYYSYS
ncbi:hypothetical protein E1B28_005746 [Marasmius oreades]|uniref:SANT domain-containing protein n=1 Tax=Marasmius oreades TaxID=181124 RepID=A0A9P7S3T0_9AGAR|nr:uncharacterized protein E1B28_005746 [Marasmius oreades]KAG7094944.1 hypothetical protein E1B28_005746 [Marasmius oreades]